MFALQGKYNTAKVFTDHAKPEAVAQLLLPFDVLAFDGGAAQEYGRIRATLRRRGTPIGRRDTLIAAHAKAEGLTLVTNNTREFMRVEGLALEDWTV
jgi:tRNA(fMet)-specific endonuclease VapC